MTESKRGRPFGTFRGRKPSNYYTCMRVPKPNMALLEEKLNEVNIRREIAGKTPIGSKAQFFQAIVWGFNPDDAVNWD